MNAPVDISSVRLETPRLILRPWRESDLSDFNEYARVDGVGQMAGWLPHGSMEKSRQILQLFIEEKKTFALELKESGKAIGSLGIEEYRQEEACVPEELSLREIGYVLNRDYWGRGLMPEAVRAVIDYCFGTMHLDALLCGHFERNLQSRRVIEKCGFQFHRELIYHTRMGTEEPSRFYILWNPKREVKHV